MRYKFFTNSLKAWTAMFEEIKKAKESIYLEMYIFNDDILELNFSDSLKQKAKEGVRVRLVLDSFGSSGLNNKATISLLESGAEVLFFSHFFHRIHRKILIVDERVAFIGGVNIHESARFWNDLVVRLTGKIVPSIISLFARLYADCGGQDQIILSKKKRKFIDKLHSWVVEHTPNTKVFGLKKVYKKNLNLAKESIILVTPYFMPKRWLILLLDNARLRGVKVEILVPKKTDSYIIDRVNHFYIKRVAKLGIDFYMEPNMNHAKVMIIDGKEAIVGSQNLDFLSFDLNYEVGVFFNDANSVKSIYNIINKWKKEAILFDDKSYKTNIFDYFLSPFINLFSKII